MEENEGNKEIRTNQHKTKEKEEPGKEGLGEKSNKFWLVIIVLLVLSVLYGLGRIISPKIAGRLGEGLIAKITGQKVEISQEGNRVTVTDENQEISFESGGKLPEGFPKDFPIYPGATLVSSFSAKGENGDGLSVVWETGDPFAKVAEFYKKGLEDGSWTIVSSYEKQGSLTSTFKKGETEGFVGIAAEEGGKVTISATIGVK